MSRMIYLPLPVLILVLFMISTANAQRVQIFDIRKSLPMNAKETAFKDYYLSGGKEVGLRDNMIVTVYRIHPVHDFARNEFRGEVKLKVGQLKIISAGENNSVGRAYRTFDRKDSPVLEFESFFLGDMVELTDAYFEKAAANNGPSDEGKAVSAGPTATEKISAAIEKIDKATNSQPTSVQAVIQLKADTVEPKPSQLPTDKSPRDPASTPVGPAAVVPTTPTVTTPPSTKSAA